MAWFKRKPKTMNERIQSGELTQGVIIIRAGYHYIEGHWCKLYDHSSGWYEFMCHDLEIEIAFHKKPQIGDALMRVVAAWDQKGNTVFIFRIIEVLKIYDNAVRKDDQYIKNLWAWAGLHLLNSKQCITCNFS